MKVKSNLNFDFKLYDTFVGASYNRKKILLNKRVGLSGLWVWLKGLLLCLIVLAFSFYFDSKLLLMYSLFSISFIIFCLFDFFRKYFWLKRKLSVNEGTIEIDDDGVFYEDNSISLKYKWSSVNLIVFVYDYMFIYGEFYIGILCRLDEKMKANYIKKIEKVKHLDIVRELEV